MKSKNLWGNLKDLKTIPTPRTYLKEQASKLAELTDGVLRGDIGQGFYFVNSHDFSYTLNIVAPKLNNYKKTILEIAHGIYPYPLQVLNCLNDKRYECNDESDFLNILGEILSSPEMRNIIESLISHSQQ